MPCRRDVLRDVFRARDALPSRLRLPDSLIERFRRRPNAGRDSGLRFLCVDADDADEAFECAEGPKLCIDIPSGLHGDTGEVLGVACHADVTVTFVLPKAGMLTQNGRAHCGRIEIAGLGLP